MAQGDLVYLGCLAVAGLGIWVRDTAWLSAPEETLAILAVVPLFVWLGAPWRIRQASGPLPLGPLVGAALAGLMARKLEPDSVLPPHVERERETVRAAL